MPCFNTVNGKHCCNQGDKDVDLCQLMGFNTVNGKHCCNQIVKVATEMVYMVFQYRKR